MRFRIPARALFAAAALTWPLAVAWARAAEPAAVVGALGDLARIEIRGARAVPADQVRRGLAGDRDVQLASTPTAPLDGFLRTTRTRLLVGYRHNGFPDPRVEVAVGPGGGVVVDVVEGARCAAGGVRVEGAVRVDARRLAAYVVTREEAAPFPMKLLEGGGAELPTWGEVSAPARSPWRAGDPAPFDEVTLERLSRDVRDGLARQGYFRTRFAVAPVVTGEVATLVVRIDDEGPPAVLGDIEVTGARRHAPAEIVSYLGLAEGQAVDAGVLQAAQGRLWRSARFWKHTLTMTPPQQAAGAAEPRVKLRIDLVEHNRVTPLGREMTAEELAVLRCRDWVEKSVAEGADLVVEGADAAVRARLVLRRDEGVALRWQPLPRPAGAPPAAGLGALTRVEAGLVITSKRVGLYDLAARQRFAWEAGGSAPPLRVSSVIRLVPDLDPGTEGKSGFLIGGGVATAGNAEDRAAGGFRFDLLLAPVSFVDLVLARADRKVDVRMDGDAFVLAVGELTFRFEGETGRLIELRGVRDGTAARVTLEPGALARELKSLDEATHRAGGAGAAAGDGDGDGDALAGAVAHALTWMSSPTTTPEQRAAGARALRKVLGPAVAAGLAELRAAAGGPDAFDIPRDPVSAPDAAAAGPLSILGEFVPAVDRVTARGTWPWTVARESLLIASRRARHTHLEAGRLYRSADLGPLGCLAVARAYAAADDPASARLFAKRGLERLTAEAFDRDCAALVEGRTAQARFLGAIARALRSLSGDELDALTVPLGHRAAAVLKSLAASQPQQPDRADEILPAPLRRALWDAGVKAWLDTALRELAATP
jgi:hypothetical protein